MIGPTTIVPRLTVDDVLGADDNGAGGGGVADFSASAPAQPAASTARASNSATLCPSPCL